MSDAKLNLPKGIQHQEVCKTFKRTIITLDMQLNQLINQNLIKSDEYKKRLGFLNQLRTQLMMLENLNQQPMREDFFDPQDYSIPFMVGKSSEEQKILKNFLKEKEALVKLLLKEIKLVQSWVSSVLGGSSLRLFFNLRLAHVKRGLNRIDKMHDSQHVQGKVIKDLVVSLKNIAKKYLEMIPQNSIRFLMSYYQQIEISHRHIKNSQMHINALHEQIQWLDSLVRFQERRLENYFPLSMIPRTMNVKDNKGSSP